MRKIILFLSFLLPFSLLLSACSTGNDQIQTNKDQLTIYTTVFPLQYFTKVIGEKYVDVKSIYPPGADEHTFEPSQKNMMNLADSDLFFYIGLGLEGFVEKSKGTLKSQNVQLVPVAEELKLTANSHEEDEEDEDHENHSSDIDPHVWLDPMYSKEMASVIRDSLVKKMPENKEYFNENYQKLAAEFEKLDANYMKTITNAKHKKIIVTHAAFGYWEERYGIEQISISGLSTTNEPTQKELEKIISAAADDDLHYVLFEENVQSKLGDIVQKEISARALSIHNLGILSTDNIKNNETYFSLMYKNLETLKTALNN
jgi:zinc transport system substrate-binding protein